MPFIQYILTGFDDFFERRKVTFTYTLPSFRLCCVCGLVPSLSKRLPCNHVACEPCTNRILKTETCPFDGRHFTAGDVVTLTFELSDLGQYDVRCPNAQKGCNFVGKLRELKDHVMMGCVHDEVPCAKGDQDVVRQVTGDHYRDRCSETSATPLVSAMEAKNATRRLKELRAGMEKFRELAIRDDRDKEAVANNANVLGKSGTSLEVCSVGGNADAVARYVRRARNILRQAKLRPCAFGPFSHSPLPASLDNSGVQLYSMFCFRDEFEPGEWKEIKDGLLAGYAFTLLYRKETGPANEMEIRFILKLRPGDFDSCLEWPFPKRITLIILHLNDETKDIRLPLRPEGGDYNMAAKKPADYVDNSGFVSDAVHWSVIDVENFSHNGTLYLHVEFE